MQGRHSHLNRRAPGKPLAAVAAASTLLAAGMAGCLNRPLEVADPKTSSTVVERLTQSRVDKIDLLLAIDNSGSMADKQEILAEAVPDLVEALVNPRCLDASGNPIAAQPKSPVELCPKGSRREFAPVADIHIGIITSSLGDYGGDSCSFKEGEFTWNDRARLIHRSAPLAKDDIATYKDSGFLAWDPLQKLDPKGEKNLGNDGSAGLIPTLKEMVRGTGQIGCGFEAQLESWYRFLVDPEPYLEVAVDGHVSKAVGVDELLLKQRAEFLRPDSLVAILMLSDENDCSMREEGIAHLATRFNDLPRMRRECGEDPASACCAPCGEEPAGCPADPTCGAEPMPDPEHANLRCFHEKDRYGFDFLYPIDRYVKGLTSDVVADRAGNLVPNPLFSDLDPTDKNTDIRDKSLVFFAGIVGVPWQDVARDPKDLTKGLKDAGELATKDEHGRSAWDVILGDSAAGTEPLDPFMKESVEPRDAGQNPITKDPVLPPGAELNGINGHERKIAGDDLQYACILPLMEPKDCTGKADCACSTPKADSPNPLCDKDAEGNSTVIQTHAKAYPGLRQLGVLKELGPQGIVASVCAAQVNDKARADYGYRPAIGALVDQLKTALGTQCLPRALKTDEDGEVNSCLIIEARATGGACECNSADARQPVTPEHMPAVDQALRDENATAAGWDCFCEIPQLKGDALEACRTEPDNSGAFTGEGGGWCYVEANEDNASLFKSCPSTEKRMVRFVGQGEVQPSATAFITCYVSSDQ